jgi:hypothetical protein
MIGDPSNLRLYEAAFHTLALLPTEGFRGARMAIWLPKMPTPLTKLNRYRPNAERL